MEELIPLEHPGVILYEEFMEPLGVTKYRLAKSIGVSATRVTDIVNAKRSISADTGLMFDKYFGVTEGFFLRLQSQYDTDLAKEKLGEKIGQIKPIALAI